MKKPFCVLIASLTLLFYGCEKIKDGIAKIVGQAEHKSVSADVKQDNTLQNGLKFISVYEINDTICVPGEHNLGTAITLLGKGTANILLASTTGKYDYDDEMNGPGSCTRLISTPPNNSIKGYSVGVVQSRIESYDLGEVKDILDDNLRKTLDRKIRSTDILQKLLLQNSGIAYDVNKDLAASEPAVSQYVIPGLTVYIVSYRLMVGDVLGPRVAVINDNPYPLTGQCSYKEIRGFKINGVYYIETGSQCCDCGITGSEIFQIDQSGPKLVHSDYSSSN